MRRDDDDFRVNLALGRRWEVAVQAWLKSRGLYLMPDYAGMNADGAPKMRGTAEGHVLPDILGADRGVMKFFEIKYRSRSVVLELVSRQVTGKIAERVWNEYLRIEEITGIQVWILFVQKLERELVGAHIKHIARFCHRGIGAGAGDVYIEYECLDRLASFADIGRFIEHGERCTCAECFEHKARALVAKPSVHRCASCDAEGQDDDITAPGFIGPLGLCVPCFRREWWAERTPAWSGSGGHGPRCACAVCFRNRIHR